MKSLFYIIGILVILVVKLKGQSAVDAAGSFVKNASFSASYAVGEIYSITQKNSARLLYSTGGVIQPDPVIISGVQDNPATIWQILPNPVYDVLMIQGAEHAVLNYQILQTDGSLIRSGLITDGRLDCTELPQGVYLLKLSSQGNNENAYLLIKI